MADNKDKKVLNVPALRFPEFTEEWKKIRLGDNCNIQMCKRIMAAQTNTEGGVPFYKIGTIGGKADAYISKDLFDEYKRKYSYPNKGEVMITCAGTVGKCVIYNGEDSYYQDSNIVWIDNPNEIISNDFLYHLLSNINWSYLNSTTIVRIYNDDLRNLKLCCPRLDEQKKIANFLSLIDERIAAQNKIIEKLETLIKGIRNNTMSKIKGDSITLQDIADIYQPQTIASTDLTENGYLVYGANGVIGKYHSYNHEKEQISITCRGNTCGTVNFTEPKSWITGNAMVVNTDKFAKNVNKRYLFHYLSSINFNSIISGSGQPQIVRQPLAKLKLILPPITIQEHIAKCLDAMLAKIKNEKSFLQKLQKQKLHLLSQMFI